MELFKIRHLDTNYYYTSNKEDIVANTPADEDGESTPVYKAIPIRRTEITRGLEENGVKITAPTKIPPFNSLYLQTTTILSEVVIYRYPDLSVLYEGRIVKSEIDYEKHTTTIYLSQKIVFNKAQIPKRTYSALCGYSFCDTYCGLYRENFKTTLYNFSISEDGKTITSANLLNKQYLKGGYVRTSNNLFSFIIEHNNNTITLFNTLFNLDDIQTIDVYPACDKSVEACNYYNNLSNYGGFPYIPDNNLTTGGF